MLTIEDLTTDQLVAEAEDLASARVAVATLLREGYERLHIFGPDDTLIESGVLVEDGQQVAWRTAGRSVDLEGRYA